MAQYNRPLASQVSGSLSWGTYGKYDKIVPVVSQSLGDERWVATGSNAGAMAFYTDAAATGEFTASLGGAIDIAEFTAGDIHELSVGELRVTAGTVFVLYSDHSFGIGW